MLPASYVREVKVKAKSKSDAVAETERPVQQIGSSSSRQTDRDRETETETETERAVSPRKTVVGVVEEIRWEPQLEEADAPTVHDTVERAREDLGLPQQERSPLSEQIAEICEVLSIETGWERENQGTDLSGRAVVGNEQAPAANPAPEAPLQPDSATQPEPEPQPEPEQDIDADHGAIQMLLMVTGKSEPECRQALAAAGGDMTQASVSLLQALAPPSLPAEHNEKTDDPLSPTLSVQDEEQERVPENARAQQQRPSSPSSPRGSLSEAMNRLCDGLLSKESVENTLHRIDTVRPDK